MNFLTIGNFFLAPALTHMGHKVIRAEDIQPPGTPEIDLQAVWAALAPADRPDLLLVVENLGLRQAPLHLDKIPVTKAFYAIDPHLNLYWHRDYAAAFDTVFTTQYNTLPALSRPGRPACFLPWAVDLKQVYDHGLPREVDIAFVGRTNPQFRLKRHLILEALSRRFHVTIRGDRPENEISSWEMGRFYSQARLVVNESISREVNFRYFESLAAGAMLLTEDIGDNLRVLFTTGEDLITFKPVDLLDKTAHYLAAETERQAIATRGQQKVLRYHHLEARACDLLRYLGEPVTRPQCFDHLAQATALLKMLRRGHYPVQLGLQRAYQHVITALQENPVSAPAYQVLSYIRLMLGDNSGARTGLEHAVNLDPHDFHGPVILGHLLARLGETEAAVASYRLGLARSGQEHTPWGQEVCRFLETGARPAAWWLAWGQIYAACGFTLEIGRFPAPEAEFFAYASDYFQQAVVSEPENLTAILTFGRLLYDAGIFSSALNFFQGAVALNPRQPESHWLLGLTQIQSYQLREGLESILYAHSLAPQYDVMAAVQKTNLPPAIFKELLTQIHQTLPPQLGG